MTTGGQILAKRLKTHIFHLSEKDAEWDTKDGLNFYHFETIGNVPEFKEMYRERLNAARVDAATRGKRYSTRFIRQGKANILLCYVDLVVAEAVKSFQLNIALFDEVEELSEKKMLAPTLLRTEIVVPHPDEELQEKKLKSTSLNWSLATSIVIGIAAIATAALVYKKVQKA